MMESRRSFLKHTLHAAGLAFIAGAMKPTETLAREGKWIPVGAIQEFPVGVPKALSDEGVIIVRTESGIRAMSLFCTHRGCPLGVKNGGGLKCPCHGAEFDLHGRVLKGPAKKPLPEVPVKVEEGEVRILNAQR